MRASGSTAAFEGLAQFDPEPGLDVERAVQNRGADKPFSEKQTRPAGAAPAKVSFGPFCLLPTQFLLREGDKPVSLGSRALRDGRDGHRFIVNIPGRGYCFVASVDVSGHEN